MKIWTYNINGLRNKTDIVKSLLEKHNIDILFLTETKIKPELEPSIAQIFSLENKNKEKETEKKEQKYNIIFNSNKRNSYHGVAFLYKAELNVKLVSNKLEYYEKTAEQKSVNLRSKNIKLILNTNKDDIAVDIQRAYETEGRILTIKLENPDKNLVIVGTYVPNSGVNREDPLKRLAFRTTMWDHDLSTYLLNLEKEHQNVIWLGDLNVARKDNDLRDVKANYAGTTLEERKNMNAFLEKSKWMDVWDVLNPTILIFKERCTYGVKGNCKLRLDYVICSSSLSTFCKVSELDQSFEGSDHVPMGATFL